MTKDEVEKILNQIKPALVPAGQLELASAEDNEIKLKLVNPPSDIFKVQGKIVKLEDEIKKKITTRLEGEFKGAKVIFI